MKRKVGVVIASVLLHSTAHAAEQATPPAVGADKMAQATVPTAAATAATALPGKQKLSRKKAQRQAKGKPDVAPDEKREPLTETPPEEQSLQLKGVRG